MAVSDRRLAKFPGWPLGKNTIADETDVPDKALREAKDVDLDNQGAPRRRPGWTQRVSADVHSLWGNGRVVLYVESGTIKRMFPDYSSTTVKSGLDPNRTVSYEDVHGDVYYSNGEDSGVLTGGVTFREWGVEDPRGQPTLAAASTGGLYAGTYQVAVVFESSSGELSGSTQAGVVTVTEGQGIQVSNIPQPISSEVVKVRLYVSNANDDTLYHNSSVPVGTTSWLVTTTIEGKELDTQFMTKMPAGQIVRHFHGRMLVARDSVLYWSQPFRLGLNGMEDYQPFPERIVAVETVQDGVYVVADKTYFLSGRDMSDVNQFIAYPQSAIEGTGGKTSATDFPFLEDVVGEVAYWFGERGQVIGLPGGSIRPMMEHRVAVDEYESGASLLKRSDGLSQLITAVTGKGQQSGFGASDSAVAEVVRNGITIT